MIFFAGMDQCEGISYPTGSEDVTKALVFQTKLQFLISEVNRLLRDIGKTAAMSGQ